MGVVFEAEQESLGRRVAVKVLPQQVLLDDKHLKRFQREARVAANLHHTNIVEVFGVGEQDGFHYYVMQFIEGVGLDAVVAEWARASHAPASDPPQPEHASAAAAVRHLLGDEDAASGRHGLHYWQSVARIGWQAADALSYAHTQGTLHRDIKPANLLFDTHGTVWLADFGLAKAAQSDDISLSSDLVGTLRYMVPEQFRGNSDQRSDIYSLALTLYELLTLRPAYEETEHSRLIQRIFTSRRQVAEARQAHLAALALLEADAALPAVPVAVRFELARTCYFLGTQERPLPAADPRQADRPAQTSGEQRDRLAKAVTLLRGLPAAPAANPEYQHLLALCYLEGAAVADARGPESKGGAEHAIEILEGLVAAFPGVDDYAYDLSEAYARIHIPRPPIPRDTERLIEERFGKSLALLAKLVLQHPDVPDFLAAKARVHDKLGAFHRQMEQWPEAEQNFRQAIAIQASLVKQFPDAAYHSLWLATFRIALADALLRRNQPGEARTELEATIAALLRQQEQRPAMQPPHELLTLGYTKLEIALRQLGEKSLGDEAGRKAGQERDSGQRSR